MGILAKKGTFLAALVAIVGLSIGSLGLSQTISFGAETDVPGTVPSYDPGPEIYGGSDPNAANFPAPGGAPPALPPAAPIDGGSDGASGGGPSGAVGADANALPSTGSGGYLDAQPANNLSYALIAFAVALALTGTLAWANSRK